MSDFPWTLADYEQRSLSVENAVGLHLAVCAFNRDCGLPVPDESEAEVRLRFLQRHLSERELRRRADAGDRSAKTQLIQDAARLETLIAEAEEAAERDVQQVRAEMRGAARV